MDIAIARIYDMMGNDPAGKLLIDRLWPRGLSKTTAPFEKWLKDIAPSPALRTWYAHEVEKYDEFAARYRDELTRPPALPLVDELRGRSRTERLTLLTATKDLKHSSAAVLRDLLNRAGP